MNLLALAAKPWALWGLLAALAVAAGASFSAGWTAQGWRRDSAALEQQVDDRAAEHRQLERLDAVADKAAKSQTAQQQRARVIYQEVERVVEKPVYRDVCLDDDGLRVLTSAIHGANDPGQPAPALPASGGSR